MSVSTIALIGFALNMIEQSKLSRLLSGFDVQVMAMFCSFLRFHIVKIEVADIKIPDFPMNPVNVSFLYQLPVLPMPSRRSLTADKLVDFTRLILKTPLWRCIFLYTGQVSLVLSKFSLLTELRGLDSLLWDSMEPSDPMLAFSSSTIMQVLLIH